MKLFGIEIVGSVIQVEELQSILNLEYSWDFYCQVMSPRGSDCEFVLLNFYKSDDVSINGWKIRPNHFTICNDYFRVYYSLVDKDGVELKRSGDYGYNDGEEEKAKRCVEVMFYNANQLTKAYKTEREYRAYKRMEGIEYSWTRNYGYSYDSVESFDSVIASANELVDKYEILIEELGKYDDEEEVAKKKEELDHRMLGNLEQIYYGGDVDEDEDVPRTFTLDETASEYQAMVNFEEKTSQEMPAYSSMEEFIRLIKDYVNPALECYDEAMDALEQDDDEEDSEVTQKKKYLEARMLKFARTLRYEKAED